MEKNKTLSGKTPEQQYVDEKMQGWIARRAVLAGIGTMVALVGAIFGFLLGSRSSHKFYLLFVLVVIGVILVWRGLKGLSGPKIRAARDQYTADYQRKHPGQD